MALKARSKINITLYAQMKLIKMSLKKENKA